ncbi:MAG: hypothetical protein A3F67_06590 [Verrucomicrobia bacterium RIFCSPHIGHO2_12_FULL_41_10]|nr:MAG: hypothetical protein A3F67_06590 [Verrucomicrobia bacterium RIFCSPHIGHO2_12_FULL_41_10]HLB34273.1 hypothetical protein [Chthoniobacterales bacterium]
MKPSIQNPPTFSLQFSDYFRPLVFILILLALLLGAFILQDTLPAFSFFSQLHLLLVPVVFCFGVLVLPISSAFFFALITAVLQGLIAQPFLDGHVEIGLGWYILFFMIWTFLLQWLSDITGGVRWELHAIGSVLCAVTLLCGEFIILSVKRGNFSLTETTTLFLIISSGASFLVAPLFYYLAQFLLPPARTSTTN